VVRPCGVVITVLPCRVSFIRVVTLPFSVTVCVIRSGTLSPSVSWYVFSKSVVRFRFDGAVSIACFSVRNL